MDEVAGWLAQVFGAGEGRALVISGTGTAGMEASVLNLVEPGDRVVAVVAGFFGERLAEMCRRAGAEVQVVRVEWGRACEPAQLERAMGEGGPVKLVAVVHAETSTGVLQPLRPLAELARRHGALLLVDAVTSLGGVPVEVEAVGIDACYSCSQKCLGCPPGLAPLFLSSRAALAMERRRTPRPTWYFDLDLLARYWGPERRYHHTAPINMMYALHRALRRALDEGLAERYRRHRLTARALWAGLEALGLRLVVDEVSLRAPTLTTVWVPDGVDEAAVRRRLLEEYAIEIGGGLGDWRGRVWRIGTMGESARVRWVAALLGALAQILSEQGWRADGGQAVSAALAAAGSA